MYVCMIYVCMHVCMIYVCMYVCMSVCIFFYLQYKHAPLLVVILCASFTFPV